MGQQPASWATTEMPVTAMVRSGCASIRRANFTKLNDANTKC